MAISRLQRPDSIAQARPYTACLHLIPLFCENTIRILIDIDLWHNPLSDLLVFQCYAEKYLYHGVHKDRLAKARARTQKPNARRKKMSIYEEMNEDATSGGMYWKPQPGKINKVRILKDPIRREADQKINRPSYQFVVTGDDPKVPLIWSVSAKGALQQIIGIMKANGLATLVGGVLQVAIAGDGMERKYTIIPIELPTPANGAQVLLDFPAGSLEKALPKLFQPDIPAAPKGA